jgi:dimethylglycine dehydrogenase
MLAEAKLAVIGGGVAGCSLLYHLARLGYTDAVLLEQHELTSGSTWHSAGLCTQFNQSYNLMGLLRRSVATYETLEDETGQAVDYHRCGSVRIATTEDRVHQFHHVAGIAASLDIPFELVSADTALELFPLMDPEGVIAAAYLPTDGHVDPSGLTHAFGRGAAALGAQICRHTHVTGLERRSGAWVLSTPKGDVRAEIVVNAAGQWARGLARSAGHDLPLVPMQHHYVVTEPIPEITVRDAELPVFRDPDRSFYCRQEHGGLLLGPFERDAQPWAADGIPDGFHSRLLPPDLDRIADHLLTAGERIPAFGDAGIRTVVNGPDAYTPDGRCLMGWVPGARDLFVLAGFSIFGIVFAGGAGSYAAEWIVDGQPSDNMWELDLRRFGPYANSTSYLVARAAEVFEDEYKIHYPDEERPGGRPLKTDPLYDRLLAKGAVMGVRSGWERPLWFAAPGQEARDEYSFRRGNWFDAVGAECRAVRSAVGVVDQTSFAKLRLSGPGAESFLDRLCANRLPPEPGRICLTQMLTPAGGIECDLTVTRVQAEEFYVVSAAAVETHDLAWIEDHLRADDSVLLDNVTARYGVLTLAGPRSRELLQRLSRDDLSREAFPFFRARHIEVAGMRVLALRVSYVGELGFELHHPPEMQRVLYDRLWEAGADLGLVDFGYRALDSLRLEKAYRLWGADMSADYTPLEAGLERFVAFDKGDFVGREALLEREPRIRLSTLVVDADGADAHAYEPVYVDGKLMTYVMAGGYGHTVGESIALAYLPIERAAEGTEVEVEILGERRLARVVELPLYDPSGKRLRS